jgi:glycosyltransferase involved in cell wall biosynthesis
MEPLKISVVIPTYQRPPLLLRCVDAVMHQTFAREAYEIIVVSDGEDAGTGRALAAMPVDRFPAVQFYGLPVKAGPAAARNFGLMLSQGDLVLFTDDDCIPEQHWLAAMWAAYERDRRPEVAFSGHTIVPIRQEPTDYEKNISQLASAEFITANCACTKKALIRVGGFDERFKMAWREDSDLQFKFIEHRIPIIKVPDAIVTHPVRKAPWGISIKEERKGMFNALLYKKFPGLYKQKIQPDPPWPYYAISAFLILFLMGVLTDKQIPKITGFTGWFTLTLWFAWKRLRHTSHSLPHVSEMMFTSAVIPVLSLFWKFYGSWKYKVLLIR